MSDEANQVEHKQITTSLEVETIEVNLFRSKSLWLPIHGRGVFGGFVSTLSTFVVRNVEGLKIGYFDSQVISQALVSATNGVDPQFSLHVSVLQSNCIAEMDSDFISVSARMCPPAEPLTST